ncbi:MGDG synthase family glycosyltransferase [Haliangium sp.]|uniref:MGDG synthase family glycosyltransferase n=1 Tax=Haliangium sp. TaxID=2663208 RepID=UPI003D1472A2
MSDPAVLLVTSVGAPAGSVTPVLAALEAADLTVRVIDVGRAGARIEGALDRMLQALAGEVAERRLLRELSMNPPDVTVAFDPATAAALSVVRDDGRHAAPVIAMVAELQPDPTWAATDADRYLTVDDHAAVELAELGVEGERIIPVGPLCEWLFVEAAREPREALRKRHRIDDGRPVVLVDVAGFGYDRTAQVALQLSLVSGSATYLFDAGNDADAATALRRQVPTLDMRAKLFGHTADMARYWRCADVVVARPTQTSVARAMVLGARMVAFLPEDGEGERLAQAVEARGLGTSAGSALLLSSALEPLLGRAPRSDARVGLDGAGNLADIAWVVGRQRREVIGERRASASESTRARVEAAASAAEAAGRATAAAGGLEDLGGEVGPDPAPPHPDDVAALRTEVRMRLAQVGRTVSEAREASERWEQRVGLARRRGDESAAREAERQCDAERARMHAALAEMAQLQAELDRLEKAASATPPPPPPRAGRPSAGGRSTGGASTRRPAGGGVDDLLEQMKRQQRTKGEAPRGPRSVDDELEALKRKMERKKKP